MNPFMQGGMYGVSYWSILPVVIWSIFWKIPALWMAAKGDQKKWFIALVIVNTFGILEIVYIFHILKKKWADVMDFYKSVKN